MKILKNILTVLTIACCLNASFAIADSPIPVFKSEGIGTKLDFVDDVIVVIDEFFFKKTRYVAAATSLILGIVALKQLAIAVPLFVIALLLVFFPKINKGLWNLGASGGIVP